MADPAATFILMAQETDRQGGSTRSHQVLQMGFRQGDRWPRNCDYIPMPDAVQAIEKTGPPISELSGGLSRTRCKRSSRCSAGPDHEQCDVHEMDPGSAAHRFRAARSGHETDQAISSKIVWGTAWQIWPFRAVDEAADLTIAPRR